MRSAIVMCAMIFVGGSLALRAFAADEADADKPKYTIKIVMTEAHKGDGALLKKVAAGNASAEEKKQLLEYYQELSKNKPPKGEAASWKEKTGALVEAAEAVVADDAQGQAKLKAATNCAACHKVHKPA